MEGKSYRKLTEAEISVLSAQGCTSESWELVEVADGFRPEFVRTVHFSGSVRLGGNGSEIPLPGGVVRRSGVYRAALHDCTVGDDALISNVGRYVANYDIGDRAVIENVGEMICDGATARFAARDDRRGQPDRQYAVAVQRSGRGVRRRGRRVVPTQRDGQQHAAVAVDGGRWRDGVRFHPGVFGAGRYGFDAAPLFRRRRGCDRERFFGREFAVFRQQPL